MPKSLAASALFALLLTLPAAARNKDKGALPPTVLRAQTVAVLIDPTAGVSLEDPQENRVAQRDVEAAIQDWGRFKIVLSTQQADLIVIVRRGHGKLVEETVSDPRQTSRPGSVTSSLDAITLGAQHGKPVPSTPGASTNANAPSGSQLDIGRRDDSFQVYENTQKTSEQDPLSAPTVWRYDARDALKPHTVPAVEKFRKALDVADKIAAQQHP